MPRQPTRADDAKGQNLPAPPVKRPLRAHDDVWQALGEYGCTLSRSAAGKTYIRLDGDRFRRLDLDASEASRTVRNIYRNRHHYRSAIGVHESLITGQNLATVMESLRAKAEEEGPTRHFMRVAWHDGADWIDLCGAGWDAVRIADGAWKIADGRSVPFIRSKTLLPMAMPTKDPVLIADAMRRFRSLWPGLDELDVVAILLICVRWLAGRGPYPVLLVTGSAGSQKTTLGKMLGSIIDPSVIGASIMPEKSRDLITLGAAGHMVMLDNVSGIDQPFSDLLCQRYDGATASYRTNYSDAGLTTLNSEGPTVITSITDLIGQPDLASRTLFVRMGAALGHQADEVVEREVQAILPGLLGGILNALALARGRIVAGEGAHVALSRLAGFEMLARAAAPAFGFSQEMVEVMFHRQQWRRDLAVMDNSSVAAGLLAWAKARHEEEGDLSPLPPGVPWKITMAVLLGKLDKAAPLAWRDLNWPKNPSQLGGYIARLRDTLARRAGLTIKSMTARDTKSGYDGHASWLEIHYQQAGTAGLVMEEVDRPGSHGLVVEDVDRPGDEPLH